MRFYMVTSIWVFVAMMGIAGVVSVIVFLMRAAWERPGAPPSRTILDRSSGETPSERRKRLGHD
jgi:hypothetical protein